MESCKADKACLQQAVARTCRPFPETFIQNCQNWRAKQVICACAYKRVSKTMPLILSERGLRVAANPRREVCGGKNVCFGVPIAECRSPTAPPSEPAPAPAPANAS